MLGPEIIERMKNYAVSHCPFSDLHLCEHAEFELTKTTRGGQSSDLEGFWYIHVWLRSIQRA